MREKIPTCFISYGKGKNVNWSHMNWAGAKRPLLIACKYALVADCHFLSTFSLCACVHACVGEDSSAFHSTCFELCLLKIYRKSELLLNLLFILHILL